MLDFDDIDVVLSDAVVDPSVSQAGTIRFFFTLQIETAKSQTVHS